jgi:hypothetical protein
MHHPVAGAVAVVVVVGEEAVVVEVVMAVEVISVAEKVVLTGNPVRAGDLTQHPDAPASVASFPTFALFVAAPSTGLLCVRPRSRRFLETMSGVATID